MTTAALAAGCFGTTRHTKRAAHGVNALFAVLSVGMAVEAVTADDCPAPGPEGCGVQMPYLAGAGTALLMAAGGTLLNLVVPLQPVRPPAPLPSFELGIAPPAPASHEVTAPGLPPTAVTLR